MSKCLSLDDMISAIERIDAPSGGRYRAMAEALGNVLAADLGARAGLAPGRCESLQGFGGTCAYFDLRKEGDEDLELPRVVGAYDPTGDWEVAGDA